MDNFINLITMKLYPGIFIINVQLKVRQHAEFFYSHMKMDQQVNTGKSIPEEMSLSDGRQTPGYWPQTIWLLSIALSGTCRELIKKQKCQGFRLNALL
ncbi:hypothetical protein GJA_4211 [Janthinobacterium agaricidamnosum NBRC 102515 = DSM 9628]|uniref:Uncharacterized protein n=1 Tax=Janthinobacterium agaricidamnosum NBRC 102515 = DSM 9628 TaxID=1349767 RepID=W0VAA6_9BURK|nr:hypothetical protein [Janthinobacterium agaricidamnosum]CDG84821.1 hypothetical protein GJA_4211 [Janthinobacterium agaricidamnosum NBRC 102515 = DSM 9628]